MKKPDNTLVYNDLILDVNPENGTATLEITSQVAAVAGDVICELYIDSTNPTSELKVLTLLIEVLPSLGTAQIESKDEFTSLQTAMSSISTSVQQAQQAASDATEAVASANTAIGTANTASATATAAAATATSAANIAKNLPYIGSDGFWYIFDVTTSAYKKSSIGTLIPKGTWVTGTYHEGEYVYYTPDNASYVALKSDVTTEPSSTNTDWQMLCKGVGTVTDNNFTNAYKSQLDNAPANINTSLSTINTTLATKASVSTYTATLTTTWTGSSAPYTQSVTATGLKTDMPKPIIDVIATSQLENDEYSKIGRFVTGENTLTATCYTDKPTVTLNLQIEVIG